MPRLVVVHPHFTYPGGASAVALETAQRLVHHGYDVHVVSLRHLSELTAPYADLQFHDLGGPLSSDFRYWMTLPAVHRRFREVVDSLRPDIVLAHVFPANYWAFIYRWQHPEIPCVWYCHEPSAFVHDHHVISGIPWAMRVGALAANPVLQVADRWLAKFPDAIIANSRYTAYRVRRIYRRSATVINPGVNLDRFFRSTQKDRMVLAVGRLTRFKRIDLLIRAAAHLKERGTCDVQWVIAGSGEEAAALHRLAAELEVSDRIRFTGRLTDAELADYFNRALIVAVTAVGEPFGIVPIEAMAAGAAVVCSDTGGPSMTVEPALTGLHFRSGDTRDLACKLATLLENTDIAREMGSRGQSIASQYTWDRTTDGIAQVLERVVASTKS